MVRFSRDRHRARYDRAVSQAINTVPHYRELHSQRDSSLAELPTLEVATVDAVFSRLFPLSGPSWSGSGRGIQRDAGISLFHALRLTGAYPLGCPVLEIRRALSDQKRIGPLGISRYASVLSADAEVSPNLKTSLNDPRDIYINELSGKKRRAVVGSRLEIQELVTRDAPRLGKLLEFYRCSLLDIKTGGAGAAPRAQNVLYDAQVGYFAVRNNSCGEFHLNWRHYFLDSNADGLLITSLRDTGPVYINFLIPDSSGFEHQYCARHDSPILVRTENMPAPPASP